ncbi:MAG: dTDP-4-dehydrorhamnose reductase [Candidatus Brocadia sp. UTAMX1]|jgi:dTDP-4-dehydrorhamnose reductase|nr:MAG: dTDP-4-dehydrorhamnose reductase [Candidatus Brocadia sp. UTAMX1]
MKILVLGSQGMLGRDLVSRLPGFALTTVPPITVIGANHAQVDITQGSDTSRFIAQERPDVIVNCAAFTNVDACETYVAEAFAVNTTGAKNIAIAGKEAGAKIIHISTDYVFDGTKNGSYVETDHPNPLSIYGKSKYKGELAIQETIGTYAIIRTSWLYGQYKKNFVTTMLDMGNRNHSVSVVTDQFGTSTYTADLSYAIWIIISKNLQGIYHVANTGTCSRYEWAKKIFELTGDQVSVYPVKTEDYKRAATVPQNSSLNCSKYTMASGYSMRPWQEALKEYLSSCPFHYSNVL